MSGGFEKITLATLGNGAAAELFQEELHKAIGNINDPNTDPKEKRKVVLEVTLQPNNEREIALMDIKVFSKLPGFRPARSAMHIVREESGLVGYQPNFIQPDLGLGNVAHIDGQARVGGDQ